MIFAFQGLSLMLSEYIEKYELPPTVIALGKTHLKDLEEYLGHSPDGITFDGIDVILHNDPIGVIMAHSNQITQPAT